ncbi:PaaX family transcriptional regulator C-terminal domain-containing protein [Rhodosalinus sp. K401]|uniref:PaaX family transcriptional regulator C-terminal domain-containing protein n=1 Tax=Rhodosalinus sp. K401 TaxID=3239195 RepID=UPI00352344EF
MDPLAPVIAALHAESRPRVWSLVITVFGDSVQPRGGSIATVRLQRLMERVGVTSGTLRTALSRLRRDGWVETERTGRHSRYRLSAEGLARFAPATARIYAPPVTAPVTEWTLCQGCEEEAGFPVAPGLRLLPGKAPEGATLAVTGQLSALAPGMREALLPPEQQAAIAALLADVAALDGPEMGPLDAAAARTLLVHRWRRLVLRWPEPPAELLPEALRPRAAASPRAAVARIYHALTPAADAWFDTPLDDVPPMPPAGPATAARFGGPAQA